MAPCDQGARSRVAAYELPWGDRTMKHRSANLRPLLLGLAAALLLTSTASAAEVRVMISGGLSVAYNALVPEFEKATGNKVVTARGPSMGTTENAIPVRLERGEPADVLIMVGYALGDLVKNGKVIADSRVDVSTEMFKKLGIAEEMKDKARKIPATPVGEIVAHGDAEIGFQQISELKAVVGIDIVGPLPNELQRIT